LFEDRVEEYNPDFTGKDFHLLHTAMGKKGQWARFHHWLHAQESSPSWETFSNTIANFHMLQFQWQAKLIYEFIKEVGVSADPKATFAIERTPNYKPVETVKCCSCGWGWPKILVMSTSLGSSCPDCYDKMSN